MRVYGIDFTSAPRPRKPITCAAGDFDGNALRVTACEAFAGFAAFEAFLRRPGPWIAGLDFPFGQPARLIRALGWGATWAGLVAHVARLGTAGFVAALRRYCDAQPPGDKHHLRRTDALAGARSPMMVYGVPVGRMFCAGAPRLLVAGVRVVPCHPVADDRVAVEAYPALVARRWTGGRAYKHDAPARQTPDHAAARRALIDGLRAGCRAHYGFALDLGDDLAAELAADPTGDRLDAVLCAVQAAWASAQPAYGVPPGCDPLEGWIVDPALAGAISDC